jgi:(2Fe-2S) ferredoxin
MKSSAAVCVLLCRDCCCGTERKHPEVDHAAQERELRVAAAIGGGRVIRTRCLGVCEHSNVVVVKTAERTHWFGGALSPEQTRAVTEFVRSAGETTAPQALEFKSVARRGAYAAE